MSLIYLVSKSFLYKLTSLIIHFIPLRRPPIFPSPQHQLPSLHGWIFLKINTVRAIRQGQEKHMALMKAQPWADEQLFFVWRRSKTWAQSETKKQQWGKLGLVTPLVGVTKNSETQLFLGVLTPFTTARGPLCMAQGSFCWSWKNEKKAIFKQQKHSSALICCWRDMEETMVSNILNRGLANVVLFNWKLSRFSGGVYYTKREILSKLQREHTTQILLTNAGDDFQMWIPDVWYPESRFV